MGGWTSEQAEVFQMGSFLSDGELVDDDANAVSHSPLGKRMSDYRRLLS